MNRRTFLKASGTAAMVVVAGGGVWRAADKGVFSSGREPAFEPWTEWRGREAEGPLASVRAAILASNAVNAQPWLYRVKSSSIELFVDQRRNIGAFDPFMRELHISAGCALENLMLASAAHGQRPVVTLVPGPLGPPSARQAPELVARADLGGGSGGESDLYDAIPNRHTNRTPFESTKPVPATFVDELIRRTSDDDRVRLFLFQGRSERVRLAHLIADAGAVIASRPEIRAAVGRWIRSDWRAITHARDGVGIGNFGESPLVTAMEKFFPPRVLRAIMPAPATAAYLDTMLTGRLFGLIAVRDRFDRADSVRAGRTWQRVHLLATARGLAARPANQSVELIDHERLWRKEPRQAALLAEVTGDPSWQPTFMFFTGYPTREARLTPRRDLHDVLI